MTPRTEYQRLYQETQKIAAECEELKGELGVALGRGSKGGRVATGSSNPHKLELGRKLEECQERLDAARAAEDAARG